MVVVNFPNKSTFKLICCDCGLTHDVRLLTDGRNIRLRFWRNNRSTGQHRRWQNITVEDVKIDGHSNND